MSANVAPSIVRTGLVLDLDAANNKSYVSGSLVWRDLTPSLITGSLINGPAYNQAGGGCIEFDAVDDGVDCGFNFNLQYFTSICWAKVVKTNYQFAFSAGNNGGPNISGWGLAFQGGNTNILFDNAGVIVVTQYNFPNLRNGSFHQIGIYRNSTNNEAGIIVNGSIFAQVTYSTAFTNTNFWVGRRGGPGFDPYFGGQISNVQVYNRALSAQEVLQNYNALKGRFGL